MDVACAMCNAKPRYGRADEHHEHAGQRRAGRDESHFNRDCLEGRDRKSRIQIQNSESKKGGESLQPGAQNPKCKIQGSTLGRRLGF